MQKRLIINADDFGINERVTCEIERAIEEGVITSTTIMANGTCLDEAARFAKTHPNISFGAHICLSEFDSLTKSPVLQKYGLTDGSGKYIRMAIFNTHRFSNELIKAIKEEIHVQIQVLKSYDIPLSHCDSHHHVHTIYGLQRVFCETIKEEGFDKIRLGRGVSTYTFFRYPIFAQKRLYVNRYYKRNFKTTEEFCSYSEFLNGIGQNVDGTIELMCHPGHEHYQDEYNMVLEKRALKKNDVQLISYLQL